MEPEQKENQEVCGNLWSGCSANHCNWAAGHLIKNECETLFTLGSQQPVLWSLITVSLLQLLNYFERRNKNNCRKSVHLLDTATRMSANTTFSFLLTGWVFLLFLIQSEDIAAHQKAIWDSTSCISLFEVLCSQSFEVFFQLDCEWIKPVPLCTNMQMHWAALV